jgi:pimeloyl-ACP methyl ester carboxylesterase
MAASRKPTPLPGTANRSPSRTSRSRRALLSLALCGALAGCATVDIDEKVFLKPDQRPPAAETLGAGYVAENVALIQADGAVSRGVYFHSPQSIATVLYFGGSSFRLDREGLPVVTGLAKAGVDVMIFDHRGYGRSEGTPTAALMRSDAQALFQFARSRARRPLVVYGLSMGSFVAASVAETQPVDGLVLEGAATSAEALVQNMFPWYVKLVARPKLAPEIAPIDNVKALRHYDGPLLMLGGEQDKLMPPSMQRSLFEQAPTANKEIRLFPGYGHKGLIESPEFPAVLKSFLAERVGARRE